MIGKRNAHLKEVEEISLTPIQEGDMAIEICNTSTWVRKDDYFINHSGEGVDMKKSWSKRTYLRLGITNQGYNRIKVYSSKVAQTCKGKSHRLGKNVIMDGQANEGHWGRKKKTFGTK
jgi:hypothetical protein